MRIGIYDPYLDDLGGGEKYMLSVAECLSKEHEVCIFWNNEDDLKDLKNRFGFSLENISLVKNIFSSQISTIQRLRASRVYDVIIVLSDGSIPLTLSKKLFLHIQQPLPVVNASSLAGKVKRSRISGIFYNSKFTESSNRNKFPGIKSTVIYPPVSVFPKHLKKENIILHVGRFRVKNVAGDFKKQGFMVEMFKKLHDENSVIKSWRFVIAASVKEDDEEQFSKLKEAAKGYPIEFMINKTNKDLWDIYNKAKIYWHASGYGEDLTNHPEFAEHFGISTVEAMGAGAVPVVINAGGQTEIVTEGENGYLWNSVKDCIEKTVKVMTDENLRSGLSENAKQQAANYSYEKFSEKINKLITS